MADRLLNYGFAILLIAAYVLAADPLERMWIVASLFVCSSVVLVAYLNNYFTIDGAGSALAVSVISVGLGSWPGALLLIFFFASHHVLTWWFGMPDHPVVSNRKNGMEIWSDTFWYVLFIALFFIFDKIWLMVAAVAAMATVIAAGWASVTSQSQSGIATSASAKQEMPSGDVGAFTFPGALIAAAAVALVAVLYLITSLSLDARAGTVIAIAGFSGCFLDSYLGAIFQVHKSAARRLPGTGEKSLLAGLHQLITNRQGVTFLAAGISSAIAVLLY